MSATKASLFRDFKNDISVALRFLKLAHSVSKTHIPLVVSSSIASMVAPFVNVIMPRYIIDEMLGHKRVDMLVLFVGVTIAANALLSIAGRFLSKKVDITNLEVIDGFELHMGRHIMNMNYENLEDPQILDMKEKAFFPVRTRNVFEQMMLNIMAIIQALLSLVFLSAIIASLNTLLIGIIVVLLIISSFIFNKSQKAEFLFHRELAPINRKFIYYFHLTSNFSVSKDIRIYNIFPLIYGKTRDFHKQALKLVGRLLRIQGNYKGFSSVITSIQMILIYSYMVFKVYAGAITLGMFTMYVSAANSFRENLSRLMTAFIEFRQTCKYLDMYMQFIERPSKQIKGDKNIPALEDLTIEFKNLYFRYPRNDSYALEDVSITIHKDEKLAVVGQNGAGKTTFIKLLCRLYEPEKGSILLNGVDIREYDYRQYMNILSVVFQDFKIFASTIKQNIVFDKENTVSDDEVMGIAEKTGLSETVGSLVQGVNTPVYKIFDENGIELSGGQNQKLAICRALFKDTPVIVLDEPTAALDPYAEAEIYANFNTLVKDRTAIFISHRLSSCRFCDRIAVFDKGSIIEYGTHDELLSMENGMYKKMWEAQAQYYI